MKIVNAHSAAIPALGLGVYRMSDAEVEAVVPALKAIGAKYGKTAAQVALRWLIECGFIALSKTAKPERVAENFDLFDFELDSEDLAAIAKLARPDGRLVSPPELAPVWDK